MKLDPDYWPAHFEAGLLFMEKYNRADAAKEFQAALEINPRAAEVHAALAELAMEDFQLEQAEASLRRAMEINPRLPAAWRLKADVAWLNDQTGEALRLLREKLLPLNPLDESTLARIAACYLVLGRPAADGPSQPQARGSMPWRRKSPSGTRTPASSTRNWPRCWKSATSRPQRNAISARPSASCRGSPNRTPDWACS